ncbi:MAG: N-acetylglucosamine-6-phosphate deacetylase [Pseudorhodobacter sp.]
MRQIFSGARIFDGQSLHENAALIVENGVIAAIEPDSQESGIQLPGGILSPAFVDLKVNGGGGIMMDGHADAGRMAAICASHILCGCAGILPTLPSSNPGEMERVIRAAISAANANVPGFLGLHLEGPFLDQRQPGLHDPKMIRKMTDADLTLLCDAATKLPALIVTLSPCAVTEDQITRLTRAGVLVALGHSDCSHSEARAAIEAGAVCATHLFMDMATMSAREPGLAGAALDGTIAISLIADGYHVAPAMLRLAARTRPEGLFLVTSALGFAGTDLTEMEVYGKHARRRDGRVVLQDGTIAGTDLRLDRAIGVMVRQAELAPERALAMATSIPAGLIGAEDRLGYLLPGRRADMVHLDEEYILTGTWWGGMPLG